MGQNQSVLDRFKAEVVQAVQDNNPRRLYHLFMLATRHQLGEIAVVPASGSSSSGNAAAALIQTIRSSAPAVTIEQYLRDMTQQTQPVNAPAYLAFHDDAKTGGAGRSSSQGQGGYTPSPPSAPNPNFPTAAPVASSASPASSYIGATLSSWFGKAAAPGSAVSPYASLPSHQQQQQQQQQQPVAPIAQSLMTQPQHPASSQSQQSQPQQNSRRLGMYAPPTLSSEQKDEADRVAEKVAAPMANLMSTAPSPVAGSSPVHQSPQHAQSSSSPRPGQSPSSSSSSSSAPAASSSPSSSSAPEFSRSSIPVNINTLYVGSDSLLIHAAKQDQPSIIHLLYQAGAEIERADVNGWSALTHAAAAGSVRAVRALLDIGADAMAKTKLGLTPSQVTSSPEIRRELEVEEMERREQLESQLQVMTATRNIPLLSQSGVPSLSTLPSAFQSSTSSITFHTALYEVIVPVEIRAGSRVDVQYRCPPLHSELDCLSVYYVDSDRRPWDMRPRMGSSFYIPTPHVGGDKYRRMTLQADAKTLPPGTYRLVYYDSSTATFPAASNVFTVIAQPSSGSSGGGGNSIASWFDPHAWSNPSSPSSHVDLTAPSASSSPVIFHPDFQLLSTPTTRNIQSFLLPIPPYFLFSFTLNPVAVRLALELDPELSGVRDQLVPGKIKEKDFWAAYFYRMVALDWRTGGYDDSGGAEQQDDAGAGEPARLEDGPIEAETPRHSTGGGGAAGGTGGGAGGGGGEGAYVAPRYSPPGQQPPQPM